MRRRGSRKARYAMFVFVLSRIWTLVVLAAICIVIWIGCAEPSEPRRFVTAVIECSKEPLSLFRSHLISQYFSNNLGDSVFAKRVYGEAFQELRRGYHVVLDDIHDNDRGSRGEWIIVDSDSKNVEASFQFTLERDSCRLDNIVVTWLDEREEPFF